MNTKQRYRDVSYFIFRDENERDRTSLIFNRLGDP